MKWLKYETLNLGPMSMINNETGEKVILGTMPTLRIVIGEPNPVNRDSNPFTLQAPVRFTWWSRVKMRLFIWRTGFVSRYYYRKWAK